MAQRSGTDILALARVYAQDNDVASNYGVGAADALLLLNDVLMRFTTHVRSKDKYFSATTTGLTFTSGTVYVETSDNTDSTRRILEFASFHPSGSASLTFPVAPALERVTVEEIQEMLGYNGDTALTAQSSEWTHVAAEKTQDATSAGAEKWRVWAYPVINRTRYMVTKAPIYAQLSAISGTPDIDEVDANHVARFLAWEIGSINRLDEGKLARILAPIPNEIRVQMDRGAVADALAQDRVDWRDW